jgi:hypothetical protein
MGIGGEVRGLGAAIALACCLGLAVFLVGGTDADAKSPESDATGTLNGRLTDWHSVPLVQADVVLRNLATGAVTHGVTGKNGSYRFSGLDPGEYRLEAELPELGKGAVEGILVSAGHATRVQAALVMELPTPTLPVDAGIRDLDPVAAAVTSVIPGEELNALPVAARNWMEFAAITPAANPSGQGGGGRGGQIGGSPSGALEETGEDRGRDTGGDAAGDIETSIDGIENAPSFRTENSGQTRGIRSLGQSAVQSMEARSGDAPADRAQTPGSTGASIDLATSHGGNHLHGQLFYLNRQSLWGAQNPFTQWVQRTAPASGVDTAQFTAEPYTPPNSRQTFGFGIGSKLKRDKLFWFAALDGALGNDPAVATVRHAEDFFAQPTLDDLTMLAARIGPASLQSAPACAPGSLAGGAVLEQAAACYSDWLGQMDGLLGRVARSSRQWQGFARLDWENEREHLSVEADGAHVAAPGGAIGRSSETYGSHSFGDRQSTDAWALAKLSSFVTPNLLNDVTALYRRNIQSETPQAPSDFEKPFLYNSWGQLPEIVADSRDGFIFGKPARLSTSSYPDEHGVIARETLSWVRGPHLLKVGASFDHVSDAVGALFNQTGTYSYPSVLNFISDAAAFRQYGINGVGDPTADHTCDATGRVYRLADGTLGGRGDLPCYAWYSQRIGPANWHVSTNDLAAFATEQWQPAHNLTLSAGVRGEAEQLPPRIEATENSDLPEAGKLPTLGLNWAPRVGLAYLPWKRTVLRVGAGLYYGRVDNSAVLAALTQTGSLNGDLNFFFRPTDVGAPAFPYVFSGVPATVVRPGAVFFASNFKTQEVEQAVFGVEQGLPGHWLIEANAMASFGRRLPVSIDTNIDATNAPQTITYAVVDASGEGPIKTPKITVPFYTARFATAPDKNYQQLDSIESRANSTYDAALIKITRSGGHGFNLHAHYLYAHATDWNPNETGQVAVDDVLDPQDFRQEYGTSNLDIRHSAGATVVYETPWKLRSWAGVVASGWSVAAVGQYRSGLPFTMRTGGYIPGYYPSTGHLLEGIGPGINGSGGDNRIYGIGRNTYRYPATWTADSRVGKRFYLAHGRELELLAESFNLFNHQNTTLLETTGYILDRGSTSGDLPTLNFLTGLTSKGAPSTTPEFGKPLDVNATNFYRPREIQVGLRARF